MQPDSGRWFVKFYAPWCAHCRNLAPQWIDLARSVPDWIHIAEVDGTQCKNLMLRFNLTYFPSLVLFINGSSFLYEEAREVRVMKGFAMYSTVDVMKNIVPYYPLSLTSMSQKLVSVVASFLQNHPLILCSMLLGTGVLIGFMVMQVIFLIREDISDDMDETPVEKEKEN